MRRFLILTLSVVFALVIALPSGIAHAAPGTGQQDGGPGTGQQNGGSGTGQQDGGPGTGQQDGGPGVSGSGTGLTNPIRFNSLPELLTAVLNAIVQIGSIILVLALVYVGFLFVVAQGNEEKIRNAKSALLWTIIGGLILLGASAIGAVIGSTVESIRP